MGIPILLIGKSGSGKSASLRNLDPSNVALINVLGKPLPFQSKFDQIMTDDYALVNSAIHRTNREIIIIDDAGYLITNQFMRGHSSAGGGNGVFALYNQIGDNFWNLIQSITALPNEKRVYIIMHEDTRDNGEVKPKSIGKLIDEKVCIEGMFTVCLRCVLIDGRRVFRTQTDGFDVAKTPIGMFESVIIDNDLKMVDETIREYYGFTQKNDTEVSA